MLAFVKGILSHRNPDRVNYINAETLLKENNINVTYSSVMKIFRMKI